MGAGMMLFMTRVRVPMSEATTSRWPSISSPCTHTSMEREARSAQAGMITSVNTIAFPKSKVTKRRAPETNTNTNTNNFIHLQMKKFTTCIHCQALNCDQ
jgi:hypothetical protein